jgi:hypothetical protein
MIRALDGKSSTLPRHREIEEYLAHKICRDLGVPPPGARRAS